jgi:hypothetical protein
VRLATLAALLIALAACSDDRSTARIYLLDGYASPLGYRGVLVPVEREVPELGPSPVMRALLNGPREEEGERGLISPLGETRLVSVRVRDGHAVVELVGRAPRDVTPGAQVLYTLTELESVTSVSLRMNGDPCCFWNMESEAVGEVTRATLAGWGSEPCHLRTSATHARC